MKISLAWLNTYLSAPITAGEADDLLLAAGFPIEERVALDNGDEMLDVEVTSAFELSENELANLKGALGRRFDKEINMTSAVDGTLIGGAIIRAGDTVIDGSVRGKLGKLAESIQRT